MALNPGQLQVAQQVYGAARGAGLGHQQALEMVAAAYAESGLNPGAVNKSSGAAGLFQLLSPGYRQKAEQLGGLNDVRANTQAILPSYLNFFRSHPGASPGEAGAAVERSGRGASFYAAPLALLGGVTGAPSTPSAPPNAAGGALAGAGLQKFSTALMTAIGHGSSLLPALELYHGLSNTPASAPSPLNFGSFRGGNSGKVDSRLIALAHHFGLRITSGFRTLAQNREVGGSPTSLHTRGEAIDVALGKNADALIGYAQSHPQQFREFFGPQPWYIKNGRVVQGAFPGHGDHVHVALSG